MIIEERINSQITRQIEIRHRTEAMRQKAERQENPNSHIPIRKSVFLGVSLAACLLLALFVPQWFHVEDSPLNELGISQPAFSEYRSASTSDKAIEVAMECKDYNAAIACIDEALAVSLKTIEQQETTDKIEDEASLYEKELEEAHVYQLRWMRIYALVSLSRNEEAIRELESFVTLDGEYQKDAKTLLNKLKETLCRAF